MALHILLVEDDAEQAILYAGVLRTAGYEVVSADSAEKAVELLAAEEFHLALIDWDLPGMTGDTLICLLRTEYPTVKTLLFSNHIDVNRIAESCGADAWLRKTEGILRLRTMIADLLQPS